MYNGTDRVKQIDALKQLAEDLYSNMPAEVTPQQINLSTVASLLDFDEIPEWFDTYDLVYVTHKVTAQLKRS